MKCQQVTTRNNNRLPLQYAQSAKLQDVRHEYTYRSPAVAAHSSLTIFHCQDCCDTVMQLPVLLDKKNIFKKIVTTL